MRRVSVTLRQLNNRLNEFLRRVQAGEELVVMDDGRPVATIAPVNAEGRTVEQRLTSVASAGELTKPQRRSLRWTRPIVIRGRPLSRTVQEDRG